MRSIFEAYTEKDGDSVKILGWLHNSGSAHLEEISAEISLKDFLGKPVKKAGASVGKTLLLPAEKTRLYIEFPLADLKDDTYEAILTVISRGAKLVSNSFKFKVDHNDRQIITLVK